MYSWPEAEWMNVMTSKEGLEVKDLNTCGLRTQKSFIQYMNTPEEVL